MTNDFEERRSESRNVIEKYYSVDFSIGDESYLYQFKIWDLSEKGMCLLVKEDSSVLKYLKVGDMVNMKYYKPDSSDPGDYLKTKIVHITKDEAGRFKGHFMIGISIMGVSDSSLQY